MKKIKINLNKENINEVLSELKLDSNDISICLTITDDTSNYEVICKSPLVNSWEFIKEENSEKKDSYYEEFVKDLESSNLNFKDLRVFINFFRSYYDLAKSKVKPKVAEVVENMKNVKSDSVYMEELIHSTLEFISNCYGNLKNKIVDYIFRDKNTDKSATFEQYFLNLIRNNG